MFAFVVLGVPGCSDDEESLQPIPQGSLSGLVTDSGGSPVAGAFINLSYTVLVGDQVVSTPLSTSMTCVPGANPMEVYDHQGRLVRDLSAEGLCGWDGLDSEGNPMPDGPYQLRLTVEDDVIESWFILVHGSLPHRAVTALVKANQDGIYTLHLADLPIWKTYPGPTEGQFVGDYSFGPEVGVHAFRGDGTTNNGTRHVAIATPRVPVTADLTIP
jgi:hypothetical protein